MRGRTVTGSLRPYPDDVAGQIADHEAEGRGREVERVRAVRDDDARRAGAEFLRHFPSEVLPILRFQVLAEDAVDHPCTDVADIQELGDTEDEFFRGHSRMDGAGSIVYVRCDGPSGAQDRDRGLATGGRWQVPLYRSRNVL